MKIFRNIKQKSFYQAFALRLPTLVLLILFLQNIFTNQVFASEGDTDNLQNDEIESAIIEILPEEILKDDFDSSGEKYTAEFFLGKIASFLRDYLKESLPSVTSILALMIVSSLLHLIDTSGTSSLSTIFTLIEALAATLIIYESQMRLLSLTVSFISSLTSFMNAMLPVMEMVYIAGGNIKTAAVSTTGIMLAITLLENSVSLLFTPLVKICMAFTVIGTLDSGNRILPILNSARKILFTLLAFVMSVLSFSLSIQTVLSSSAETLASRSIKFAVGNFIPIVGGAVNDAFSTITAGSNALRQSVGGIAVTVIILLLISPIAALLANKLIFDVSSSLSSFTGADTVSAVLREASGTCALLSALAITSALFFLLGIFIFAKTGAAI